MTTQPGSPNDPSMEDILASIRRILSEDENAAQQAQAVPMAPPVAPPFAPPVAGVAPQPANAVLNLESFMMVRQPVSGPGNASPGSVGGMASPGAPPDLGALRAAQLPSGVPQVPQPHISSQGATPTAIFSMHPPVEQQPAADVAEPVLVAQEAAAATSASIGQLLRTLSQTQADPAPAPVPAEPPMLVSLGGPTLEDMVRSELRGLLKQWLDTHLPSMVERLVHSEIQRLVSR